MAAKAKTKTPGLLQRTPVAEWTAAALGLVLTLGVMGYLVREGLTEGDGPPSLSVTAEPAQATGGRFVVPVTVANGSDATAAGVEVLGTLEDGAAVIEERRASFAYVPGQGEARGGLVFQHDPRRYRLRLSAEGYEEP